MGYIVAIVNNKGGVGKTTSTCNLAHAVANRGKKVLIADIDNQSNSTSLMLNQEIISHTIYDLYENDNLSIDRCIYPTAYDRLHCLPNSIKTASIEPKLSSLGVSGWEILRYKLRDYALEHFDVTFIDCPPNLGVFVLQAMLTSDFVIIPLECGSRFSMEGLTRTVSTIEQVQEERNPDLKLLRLLINKVDKRTAISKMTIAQIREWYGEMVFKTVLSNATALQQAELARQTVVRFLPNSPISKQFRELSKEFIDTLFPE